ncbi:MAG: acyl-CoA dehydrogenase, partial [Alphaproteobacteria bacterium]|nr:acyl-CoA dehydrogenase [Alphaproteobacteria bacterium]
MINFSPTQEQQGWIEKADRLASQFATRARKYDESAAFPAENFAALREEGFLKLAVPREFGGLGDMASGCAFTPHFVLERIARGCASTGWCLLTHYQYCGLLAGLGNDAQRARVFADVVTRGALIGSIGSEVNPEQTKTPTQTTGTMGFQARLEPVDGGFVVNGRKGFCSLAPVSDYVIYWALAPGTEALADGLVLSLIPGNAPGLTYLPGWEEAIG